MAFQRVVSISSCLLISSYCNFQYSFESLVRSELQQGKYHLELPLSTRSSRLHYCWVTLTLGLIFPLRAVFAFWVVSKHFFHQINRCKILQKVEWQTIFVSFSRLMLRNTGRYEIIFSRPQIYGNFKIHFRSRPVPIVCSQFEIFHKTNCVEDYTAPLHIKKHFSTYTKGNENYW